MSWTNRSDAAASAIAWQIIETEARKRKDEARAWLIEHLDAESSQTRALVDDRELGKATLTHGKTAPRVTDDRAFLAFVKATYPTELVESVNSAWQTAYFAGLSQVDDGKAVDPNGHLVEGVEFITGRDTLTVTKTKDARQIVAELLAHGRATLGSGLLPRDAIEAHLWVPPDELRNAPQWVKDAERQRQQHRPACVCGEPGSEGVVHRTDGPCFVSPSQFDGASHLVDHLPTEDQVINWNEANDYVGEADYGDEG